ncbi:MAG: Mu-like prophage major head subunit gpT family protein [Candidatus Magasanikiibacteriota bacterium]
MSIINSGSFAKALWPGVNAWYGKSYSEYETEYDKLFDKNTSTKAFEEDVGISSFGLAVNKPEGSPISYDSERQAFITRYQHAVFALGFVITREMMEDDQYDVVGQRKAQGLAFSMRQTKEVIAANVYNRAYTAGYVGGDGVVMLSASHVNLKGGTWSNTIATNADLSEAALEQACIDIAGFTNDAGLLIAVRPESLIIPRQLIFEAKRILGTDGRVGTADNDLNAIKTLGSIPKIVTNHYLTDTDAWFIRTNVQHGMKYFERRADQFDMDNDWDTENAKFKATARYSFGWTDPRGIYGSAGA